VSATRLPLPSNPDLLMQRLRLSDADEWAQYAVLPEVTRLTSSTAASVEDLIPLIDRSLAGEASSPVLFAVRSRQHGRLVATVGFHTIMAHNRTAEITYDVHPRHWGHGIATDCCRAAVRWGFSVRDWVRVQGTTQEPNAASQAVLRKCGFSYEGKLRNFRIVRGQPCDYLLFAIVPSDALANAT
jgi:[ribosomal protein S5]-alanine N-acetyltransferase